MKLGNLGFGFVVKNDVSDLASFTFTDVTTTLVSFFAPVVVVVVVEDFAVALPAEGVVAAFFVGGADLFNESVGLRFFVLSKNYQANQPERPSY